MLQIGNEDDCEFAAYRVGPGHGEIELAKVCITYLNFQDFDLGGLATKETAQRRFQDYPLRVYVVNLCWEHAREYLSDPELLSLIKEFLSPSKPNNLVSWAQDLMDYYVSSAVYDNKPALALFNSAIAEASALHFAAMLAIPDVCRWLIECGCDVNRSSTFGSPLHCALLGTEAFSGFYDYPLAGTDSNSHGSAEQSTINLILDAGADPNCPLNASIRTHSNSLAPTCKISPLFMALSSNNPVSTVRLLDKGGKPDERCVAWLEEGDIDEIHEIIAHITNDNVRAEHCSRLLQLALRAEHAGMPSLLGRMDLKDKDGLVPYSHHEPLLRTAAEFGQSGIVVQLLGEHKLDLQCAQEDTGFTALHYAAMNNHLEVVKLLMARGAQYCLVDCAGRTAVHRSVEGPGLDCLEFFMKQNMGIDATDHEGLTIWHLAALDGNTQALNILLKHPTNVPLLCDLKAKDGRSPLLCAASKGSMESVNLLLNAGCRVSEAADDGSTPLHQAAKSGSLETVQLLIERGSDIYAVTHDGSSMLHYAILGTGERLSIVVDFFLERGLDPCKIRKDGALPIHLLIGDSADGAYDIERGKSIKLLAQRPSHANAEGLTPLNQICLLHPSGNSEWRLIMLKVFLDSGANLESKDPSGKTALRALTDVWQMSCVEWDKSRPKGDPLIASTAMIHTALDYVPRTGPLHEICTDPGLTISALMVYDEKLAYKLLEHYPDVASAIGEMSIIKAACRLGCSRTLFLDLLERFSASSDKEHGSELVRLACVNNTPTSHEIISELLKAGFSTNGRSSTGESSLMFAARYGNVDIVKLLLSYGADPNLYDDAGCNVVHIACIAGHEEIVYLLRDTEVDWNRKAKASIHSQQIQGVTALHLAAALPDDRILEYLLTESLVSDINSITDSSQTALHIAARSGLPRNVSSLLTKNANATVEDFRGGECAVHIATRFGNENVIAEFIRHGCDVNLLDSSGLNCEMLAWKYGHRHLAKILREHVRVQGMSLSTRFSIGDYYIRHASTDL